MDAIGVEVGFYITLGVDIVRLNGQKKPSTQKCL